MSYDFICNVVLGTLCVYQGYCIKKLRQDTLTQLCTLWLFQKDILHLIKRLYERNENEESNIDD